MRTIDSYGLVALVLLAGGCAGTPEEPGGSGLSTAVLGTNLSVMADWSPEITSIDLFKMSRRFFSGTAEVWQDERNLDVDAHGWVRSLQSGQVARTVMFSEDIVYPAGDYTMLYDGAGTVEYQYSNQTNRVEYSGSGREVLSLDPKYGGLSITIYETDPQDYLRNFRILLPGGTCEGTVDVWCDDRHACPSGRCVAFDHDDELRQFNPDFADRTRSYGVLRFMDWMQTNGSTQRTWSDRPLPDDATWSAKGVPVEIMVALANYVGKDPWFCMPHLADNDYIERFASYVRDNLAPDRKAYVEYSNEVWNNLFPQADYAVAQGVRGNLGNSEFEAQLHFYARRTTEVHKIWERVFRGNARLVRVVASQAINPWVSSTVLQFEDTAEHADVLAIAPYFGSELGEPREQARVERMTVDDLMAELRTTSLPIAIGGMRGHSVVARQHHVDLVAYEGGQHLVGTGANVDSDRLNALFDAANRDPRMKDIYRDYLHAWRRSGGRLFVHFTSVGVPSKWGRWGALEWMQQPRNAAPKFDAIMEFAESNPIWW
jgi:hypothetical protein